MAVDRWRMRSLPSRWNGWKRRSTSSGGITGSGVAHRDARASGASSRGDLDPASADVVAQRVVDEVGDQALDEARVAGWPVAGASARRSWMSRRSASSWRLQDDAPRRARRDRTTAHRSTPRSLVARVSRASIRRSCWLAELRAPARSSIAGSRRRRRGRRARPAGAVRCPASGVRSSWEALATKWRCDSNDASSRPKRSSSVRPSSVSSSSGPSRSSRRWRFVAEISWAAVVIARSGRRNLPASHQATASATAAAISAISAGPTSKWCATRPAGRPPTTPRGSPHLAAADQRSGARAAPRPAGR